MKKTKNLLIASLAVLTMGLVSCNDPLIAKTNNSNTKVVEIGEKDYFRNNLQQIYLNYRKEGTAVEDIFSYMMADLAEVEIKEDNFVSEDKVVALCKEELVNKVKDSTTYSVNGLFQEEKFFNELQSQGYKITYKEGKTSFNNDYEIPVEIPSEYEEEYKNSTYTEFLFDHLFNGDYSDYITKSIRPTVVKKLLTAKYLCTNSISSISRAAARDVQYIKLENLSNHDGDVNKLIQAWLNDKLTNSPSDIDLDDLQKIYKGEATVSYYTGATTRSIVTEDLKKITVDGTANGKLLPDEKTDKTIENKYTGSAADKVSLAWGVILKNRELNAQDFTGDDLYTVSGGISDLPEEIKNRLFSSSISSYLTDGDVKFLKPKTYEATSKYGQYYHYDSSSSAYYIVIVKNYYTSTKVNTLLSENKKEDGSYDWSKLEKIVDIAYELSSSTTNEGQAVLKYLEEYGIEDKIHDEYFYNYIKDKYSTLFD